MQGESDVDVASTADHLIQQVIIHHANNAANTEKIFREFS